MGKMVPKKREISNEEAVKIADKYMLDKYEVSGVERITSMADHHEYRGDLLPAFVISYNIDENLKAYVSAVDGTFSNSKTPKINVI